MCNGLQYTAHSLWCKHGFMEGVWFTVLKMQCSFYLRRCSISCAAGVRQSEMRCILCQCMLMPSKYWGTHNLFTVHISLNLLAKKHIKANSSCTGNWVNFTTQSWLANTGKHSGGGLYRWSFLDRYALESK